MPSSKRSTCHASGALCLCFWIASAAIPASWSADRPICSPFIFRAAASSLEKLSLPSSMVLVRIAFQRILRGQVADSRSKDRNRGRKSGVLNPRTMTGSLAKLIHQPNEAAADGLTLTFDDNRLLSLVFGEHDEHLALIESRLGVDITPRGNRIAMRGPKAACESAAQVLERLYGLALKGQDVGLGDVEGAIRMVRVDEAPASGEAVIRTKR